MALCAAALSVAMLAGQSANPSPPAQPDASSQPSSDSSGQQSKNKKQPPLQLNKDRVFGVAPNYLTVDDATQPFQALTSRQKFFLASRVSFDPFAFPEAAILAYTSRSQTTSWGNSAGGLAKRYGAAFADETISTYTKKAIMPSLLHEDPRYFRLGKGSFFKRTGYAVSRVAIAKNDEGVWGFNYAGIIGTGMGAGISNLYYPTQARTLNKTMSRWGTQLAVNALDNTLREYWPDIRVHVFHKKNPW